MTMAMTLAKIGCSIKNFDMDTAAPARSTGRLGRRDGACWGRTGPQRRLASPLGRHFTAGDGTQQAFDDQPFVALQAGRDDPLLADLLTGLHRLPLDDVLVVDRQHVGALL